MSDSEVSGEEGSLCIDTKRAKADTPKKKGGGVGKGRKAGRRGKGQAQPESDGPPKPGDIVWAKVMGFNFWPAKLFDAAGDDMVPEWLKQPPKPTYMLVRFFGTYDMQWVSPSSVETYARGLKKKFQAKSKSKAFQKAMLEVTDYMEKSIVPEGLTVSPPYPLSEEDGKKLGKRRREKRGNGHDKELDSSQVTDAANDTNTDDPQNTSQDMEDGVEDDSKKSPSVKPPSSPPTKSKSKRPRLEDENGEKTEKDADRLVSPEVEAFTSAPLSSFSSSKEAGQAAGQDAGQEAAVSKDADVSDPPAPSSASVDT